MNQTADHLEVEVKFHLDHPQRMHRHLINLGAVAGPRVFETNLRFDDKGQSLKSGRRLLRLRRDSRCRLTFKGPPPPNRSECKVFREFEVDVSDFQTMCTILAEIGYHPVQTYEKWRQTFTWDDVELCMDTMPYGAFLEIEGSEKAIKSTAGRLQLPWERRILSNYLAIFETVRHHFKLPFHDLTFSNFEQHPVDITPLLDRFEIASQAGSHDGSYHKH